MNQKYLRALEVQSEWLRWGRDKGEVLWKEIPIGGLAKPDTRSRVRQYGDRGFGNPSTERLFYDDVLSGGECIFVSEQFSRYIEEAAPTFPGDVPFRVDHLPAPSGFVFFDQQMYVGTSGPDWKDVPADLPLHIAAIGWTPHREGVQFMTFMFAIEEGRGGWLPYTFMGLHDGDRLDQRIAEYEGNTANDARYVDTSHHELRIFYALLALMNQRLVVLTKERVDRPAQRRAAAAGRVNYGHVSVVEFRRGESKTRYTEVEEARAVDWKCRWIVRGHWRNQYLPSTGRHEPRYIESFVKGPEGLPVKDDQRRLFAVVR